jgi:inner membrane protein
LSDHFEQRISSYKAYFFWGLFGAIAPDTDYVYLFLFDSLNQNHHSYITHFPYFWITLLLFSAFWFNVNKKSQNPVLALLFSVGGLIHLMLDTISSKIFWLAPFSFKPFSFESLIRAYAPSIMENNPNWENTIESLIILWAIYLFVEHKWNANVLTQSKNES